MTRKFKAGVPYEDALYQELQDEEFAIAYLNAALDDGEPQVFLLALRHLVQARGGFTEIARKAGLNRSQLYHILSLKGNPRFYSFNSILDSLGMHFSIQSSKETRF